MNKQKTSKPKKLPDFEMLSREGKGYPWVRKQDFLGYVLGRTLGKKLWITMKEHKLMRVKSIDKPNKM